jgi:hypothetical protein
LAQVPGLVYLLKLQYHPSDNRISSFTLIHADGKPNLLRINDIELRYIGIQVYSNYDRMSKAEFTFYDYKLKQTIQHVLSTNDGPKFVLNELIPFMQSYVNNMVQLVPSETQTTEIKIHDSDLSSTPSTNIKI